MKKKKRTIILIALLTIGSIAAVAGIYLANHYFFFDDYKEWVKPAAQAQPASELVLIKESKSDVDGMSLVSENDNFKLYTDLETTTVAVYDKKSGMTVYSNPIEGTEDALASGTNLSELQSQVVIEYYDAKRNRIRINNYDMSISRDQFTVEQLDQGLRYTYTLADMTSATGIVPINISEEALEAILSKLDDREASDVRAKYAKSKETEGEMILTENAIKSPIRMERLNELFEKAGFTQADYEALLGEEDGSQPLSLTLAIDYQLTNTGVTVTIPRELIQESEGASIANIEVLKFFGAQGMDEEGYLFVPNGSGSLIYFNNGKKNDAYSQYVYDMDVPGKSYIVTEDRQVARLPVFGIKNNEGAVFAIIESGDAVSQINADVAAKRNSYNYIYPTYALRGYELLSMFGTTGASADLPIVEKELADISFTISYHLLAGEEMGYSEMAAFYQNKLVSDDILTAKETQSALPFYLDVLGSAEQQKERLGVPYQSTTVMTTYEQAMEMVTTMQDLGVSNLHVNYLGWFNGGYYHDAADQIKAVKKLGKQADLEDLKTMVEESGGQLYGDVAFQKVSETSKRYNLTLESSKYYSGMAVVRGKVNPATVRETSSLGYDEAIYSIVSPKFLNRYVSGFSQDINEYAFSGISLRDLGDVLSSDKKRTELINRQAAKDVVEQAFNQLEETGKSLMTSGGNAYALAYVDDIVDLPMSGTDFYLVDEHVPFYQLVLNGYVSYAADSINLNGDVDEESLLLDLIETGSAPRYLFSYEDSAQLKYSSVNHFFSTDYQVWLDHATHLYNRLNDAHQSVIGSQLISHHILENGLRKVSYDNGISFYINRSQTDVEQNGVLIPAMSFVEVEEG